MTTRQDPSVFFAAGAERTEADFRGYMQDLDRAIGEMPGGAAATTLTIASGVVTPTGAEHAIETQGGAPSDDLTNIATDNLEDGAWLILRAADTTHDVVVKHAATGAGQIHLATGADLTLADTESAVLLRRSGADWYEMFRGYGTAAGWRSFLGLTIGTDVQAYNADLAAIAALTSAANQLPYATGAGTWAMTTITATSRNLLDDPSLASWRTSLGLAIGTDVQAYDAELAAIAGLVSAADRLPYFTGLGTAALATFTAAGRALVDDADAAAQRTTLGLVIGTDVQAQDAELAAIAGLVSAADRLPYFTGSGTAALATFTTAGRALVDDANAAAQRTTLGLGTIATQAASAVAITGGSITGITDLAVADGGTGASTASAARTNLGLVIGTDVQAYDGELAAIAGLTSAADRLPYFTGSGTAALATFTTFGRSLVDDADAAAARVTLGVRDVLTTNRTYYVRKDGSDSNNGLADTAGGAFLTIAKALAVVAALDLGGFIVAVQVRTGTYAEAVVLPRIVGGTAQLIGDTTTPGNVVIAPATGIGIGIDGASGWSIGGFKASSSNLWAVYAANGAGLTISGKMEFGASSLAHIYVGSNAVVQANADYTISGASAVHWQVYDGARLICQARTITITGTPAFGTAFALAGRAASMSVNANTFSGAATGSRYLTSGGGIIDVAGSATTYLPGNAAGTGTNFGVSPYGYYG